MRAMTKTMPVGPIRARGFSLVEMMVALAAGLVVIGSVVVFTIATARSSSEEIGFTRLSQVLRGQMNIMSRELRRAGANMQSMDTIGAALTPANYSSVVISTDRQCVVFGYDTPARPAATPAGQPEIWRGFRRTTVNGIGVIQMTTDNNTGNTCSQSHTWVNLSDPAVVNISALQFVAGNMVWDTATSKMKFSPGAPTAINSGETDFTTGLGIYVTIRPIQITVSGTLVNARPPADTVVRELSQIVRIRADQLTQI